MPSEKSKELETSMRILPFRLPSPASSSTPKETPPAVALTTISPWVVGYLLEEGALLGDEHTAFDVGEEHPHGYALYFFTRRALQLLEG